MEENQTLNTEVEETNTGTVETEPQTTEPKWSQ